MARVNRRWAAAVSALLAITTAACVQILPGTGPLGSGTVVTPAEQAGAQPGTTNAGTEAESVAAESTATPPPGRQLVAVRRGTIAEILPLSGRVTALEETPVTFPILGRVDTVLVKPGDPVEQGQVILQAETAELRRDLAAARSRLELSTLRLDQARVQAQARQRQTEQQIEAERTRLVRAVADAEAGVRRALDDLARVKAGAPAADRRAAETAVVSARSGVSRAEAELARANAGPSEDALKAADQQVWAARLAQQRAEAEFQRLKQGPDPVALRAAERDVAAAQATLVRARLDLERMATGDPQVVSAAQRDVQRAEMALRTAEATRIDGGGSKSAQRSARAARDASIANARLTLQDAQERLNAARRGPPPAELELARRAVVDAQASLDAARERYENVKKGPDEMTLATANQAVEAARIATRDAERRYLELAAGPPPDRVEAAQDAVRNARAALDSAISRLTELNSRPTREELQAAEERVEVARAALDQAISVPEPEQAQADPAAYDLIVLEKTVEQDRAQVESLERDLIATDVTAPISGVVSAVQVRPGDPAERGAPVVVIARPGPPIVTLDVNGDDVSRVAVGQVASVILEGAPDTEYTAVIVALASGPGGVGQSAQLQVNWQGSPPLYGLAAQAGVTLQEKSDVLLVPQRAVRTSGQRRYVEYLDGDSRRTADVALGISGISEVEVIRGVREGQLILVGAASATAGATPDAAPSPETAR
jgi:multidrug efflux pump subunit AcrA (membrane-fusion protein)